MCLTLRIGVDGSLHALRGWPRVEQKATPCRRRLPEATWGYHVTPGPTIAPADRSCACMQGIHHIRRRDFPLAGVDHHISRILTPLLSDDAVLEAVEALADTPAFRGEDPEGILGSLLCAPLPRRGSPVNSQSVPARGVVPQCLLAPCSRCTHAVLPPCSRCERGHCQAASGLPSALDLCVDVLLCTARMIHSR